MSGILKDKNFRTELKSLITETQKHGENVNAIKIKGLNWNRNPLTKEKAEKFSVFENLPSFSENLNLDPANLDPSLKETLKEMGVIKDKVQKLRPKAKTTYFSDIITKTDGETKGEILNKTIKENIRIKND